MTSNNCSFLMAKGIFLITMAVGINSSSSMVSVSLMVLLTELSSSLPIFEPDGSEDWSPELSPDPRPPCFSFCWYNRDESSLPLASKDDKVECCCCCCCSTHGPTLAEAATLEPEFWFNHEFCKLSVFLEVDPDNLW